MPVAMACAGVLAFSSVPKNSDPSSSSSSSKVCRSSTATVSCVSHCVCSAASTSTATEQANLQKFSYSRASPSVRWPHLKLTENYPPSQRPTHVVEDVGLLEDTHDSLGKEEIREIGEAGFGEGLELGDETQDFLGKTSKNRVKKMTKLALKRAKDWRQRVQFLTDRILGLKSEEFVADVLDDRKVQMTPTDFCFVVKWVGQSSWQRALEVYEWLNLRHWYSPNARMLATILSVLGKANQEALAVEIFARAEAASGNTVQVYNAMMGVYARTGTMVTNLAIELLNEVRRSGIQPDIITYNTLISACSRESNLEEAVKVYNDMVAHRCQPDLWTYNAMISVYGRCGMSREAERECDKVKEICEDMVKMGFGKDEMTYNTIIHMYGKRGQHDLAFQLYSDMKLSGRSPDAVTYTVLIDSLGKANMIKEAAEVMSEMLNARVKPTLRTFSALICGYAKAGKRVEAEETFDCMLRSGIKPDHLAYSVMLDILLRFNESGKAMKLYQEMVLHSFKPDHALYEVMLRVLGKENREEDVHKCGQGYGGVMWAVNLTVRICYLFWVHMVHLEDTWSTGVA
ncbi:Pentatricopeptide repeat-containing protein, chloroplastic [Vitis vinifera]|uniref:Pentatricopeptide repeat-containing protein, chloroplastic n=1 Tax=Vitis vinifera TaxID=29760 RepID=A0A438E239_VITVI|nr:Pentatricopeptide repeat-containing protein, chloroplastic [Vitis vinifera]